VAKKLLVNILWKKLKKNLQQSNQIISRASLKTPEWCKFKEGKKHRPIGHALQPDAEVVPLWSSNLCAKILSEFIDFKANLPCTLSAKKMAKALPSLISCVFKKALSLLFSLCLLFACNKKTISYKVSYLHTPTNASMYSITQLSNGALLIGGGQEYTSANCYTYLNNTWQNINVNFAYPKYINALYTHQYIYAGGGSSMASISKDSGKSFTAIPALANLDDINDFIIANDTLYVALGKYNLGYIVAMNKDATQLYYKHLYNWEVNKLTTTNNITYAAGNGAILYKQPNTSTWRYTAAEGDIYTGITSTTNGTIVACGFNGSIIKSTNNGASFTTLHKANTFNNAYRWQAITCLSNNLAIVVGDKGKAAEINLDNNTITYINNINNYDIEDVVTMANNKVALACNNGILIMLEK
jgi:photosystem II stability/assembly factor-like uncharacterized protein